MKYQLTTYKWVQCVCYTDLSNLQYWVNVVQVHRKQIVLHVIHHPWTANVVKGFLKPNGPNTCAGALNKAGRQHHAQQCEQQWEENWPLGRKCRGWCGLVGPPGWRFAKHELLLTVRQTQRQHSLLLERCRRRRTCCPTEERRGKLFKEV